MVAIAFANRLAGGQDPLASTPRFGPPHLTAVRRRTLNPCLQWCIAELAQLGRKSGLDSLGISRRELVFEGKNTVRPGGKSIRFTHLLKFGEQLQAKLIRRLRWETCRPDSAGMGSSFRARRRVVGRLCRGSLVQ